MSWQVQALAIPVLGRVF